MKRFISLFVLILVLNSCARYVTVNISKPAEISTDLFKKAAIGSVLIKDSIQFDATSFRKALLEALTKKNHFQIIDTSLGISKENPELIINVSIESSNYSEEIHKETFKDSEGVSHEKQTRSGSHTLVARYKLATLKGEIIGEKTVKSKSNIFNDAIDKFPPFFINHESLESQSISISIYKFIHSIEPYNKQVSLELFEDKSIPELKEGIDAADKGNWNLALTQFTKATKYYNNPNVQYAHYNLGIAYLNENNFQKARISLQKALDMKGSDMVYKRVFQVLDQMELHDLK